MAEQQPKRRRFSLFPKTLSTCIEPITKPVFKAQGLAGTRLLTEWAQIVGPALAARSMPLKINFPAGKTSGGTLTISVQNGFAPEMQHMQPIILERLATYYGYKAVDRITISHTHLNAPPKPAQLSKKSHYLSKDSAHLADTVEDPELKSALQSFADSLSGKNNA